MSSRPDPNAASGVPGWRELVAPYAKANGRRGVLELFCTALPFLTLVAGVFLGLTHEIWPTLVLVLPASAFLVRLFIIQHDCGHGSYFKARWANDLLGRIIGIFTLTPYAFWRRDHALHHATSGNLSRRGIGDITTLTAREYFARSAPRRLLYRLYRHPLTLFIVGPAYQSLLLHRIPRGSLAHNREGWLSVVGTNAALAALPGIGSGVRASSKRGGRGWPGSPPLGNSGRETQPGDATLAGSCRRSGARSPP